MFGVPYPATVAPQLWPDKRADGGVTVAVRFVGPGPDLTREVGRLLASWEAEVFRSGRDLLADLDRSPWVEATEDGVEVVFEGRSGNRTWKDWMVWLTSYVDASDVDVRHVAFADRIGGRVRLAIDSGANPSA